MADKTPNPGSPKAAAIGCRCAVLDNNHGRYAPYPPDGWWVAADCPDITETLLDYCDCDGHGCEPCYAAEVIMRLRALVDDYENGISWYTTCTNCAKLMDVNYDQYCQIERLRAAGDALVDAVERQQWSTVDVAVAAWKEARRG